MMKSIFVLSSSLLVLAACQDTAVDAAATEQTPPTTEVTEAAKAVESVAQETLRADQDISTLPAGRYVDEDDHAYIAFSYDHQGYSHPILRFNGDAFEAVIMLDPDAPTNSTLTVELDPSMIDSGVPKFNDHLKSADMFEVETFPQVTFTSTSLSMDTPTTGTLVGDLTMKDVTKSVALDVTMNKAGEAMRSGEPMFGISASGTLMRSDWGLGYATQMVGDKVDLMIEVEFRKADEG